MAPLTSRGLLITLFTLAACGGSGSRDEGENTSDALQEATTPRKGSTINSPSVDANKDYWGARKIQELVDVGYLKPEEADVAKRADGIVANSPPNGALGVEELAILESPEHIHTLFPAERAVLPKLWSILQIAPATPVSSAASTVQATTIDAYTPSPLELPIASLTPPVQTLARRIELSANSDGNDQTISGADVAAAYADKASYLPHEVLQFSTISYSIAVASKRLPRETQRVEVANPVSSKVTLFNQGGVSAEATTALRIVGQYSLGSDGATAPKPELELATSFSLAVSGNTTKVIILNRESGESQPGRAGSSFWPKSHVELWTNGTRAAVFEINAPPAPVRQAIPFGYLVKLGGKEQTLQCRYGHAACTYAPRAPAAPASSSSSLTPSGSYRVLPSSVNARIDVFEAGYAVVTEGTKKSVCFPDATTPYGEIVSCRVFGGPTRTLSFAKTADLGDHAALGWFGPQREGLYPL